MFVSSFSPNFHLYYFDGLLQISKDKQERAQQASRPLAERNCFSSQIALRALLFAGRRLDTKFHFRTHGAFARSLGPVLRREFKLGERTELKHNNANAAAE